MDKTFYIELAALYLGQLLDGLRAHAEGWEKTADNHRADESLPEFIVEECADAEEADRIAAYHRSIFQD